jgi:WD40 repeat protein
MSTTTLLECTELSPTTPTLLITPTTLVCISREKLTSFVRYLEHGLLLENTLVDMDVLRTSAEPLFYLDLAQVAAISVDAASWLKDRRCGIVTGCRFDGYDAAQLSGYSIALRMLYPGSVWNSQRYGLLVADAEDIVMRLTKGGVQCLLQQQLDQFNALTPSEALEPWAAASLTRAFDLDFPLEPGTQVLPLIWSEDGETVVCGLLDVAIDRRTRNRVILAADITTRGELLHRFDLATLLRSSTYKRHAAGEELTTCSVSPDGRCLALVLSSKTIICDMVDGGVLRVIPATGNPVVWSSESDLLALCHTLHYDHAKGISENRVELWEVFSSSRHALQVYDGHCNERVVTEAAAVLRSASWSADQRLVVTAGSTCGLAASAHVWNASNGALRHVYRKHADRVVTAVFSPAQTPDPLVASVGEDHTVQIWHALSGERVFLAHTNTTSFKDGWLHERRVAWSPDGETIAFQNERDELVTARVVTGHIETVCGLAPFSLLDVAWSPDGKHLATIEVNLEAEGDDVPYCVCVRPVGQQDK